MIFSVTAQNQIGVKIFIISINEPEEINSVTLINIKISKKKNLKVTKVYKKQ